MLATGINFVDFAIHFETPSSITSSGFTQTYIQLITMAQGGRKLKAAAPSGGRKKGGTMPKGKREVAPKSAARIAEKSQKKVSTSTIRVKCRFR
jgi:hypothetical protein